MAWSGQSHDRERRPEPKNADEQERPADEDVVTTPSQAEGDRETVEEDLERAPEGRPETGHAGQGDRINTPSQAEGDRQTIERDLEEKSK